MVLPILMEKFRNEDIAFDTQSKADISNNHGDVNDLILKHAS